MSGPQKKLNIGVALYIRESRDDNFENYETIETQKGLLIDYVAKNGLGNIYDIYIDDNISGSSFDRQGLNKLQEDAIQGKIKLVVLKDLSRLGRNNAKTLIFLEMLEDLGVRVITVDGRYDSLQDNEMLGIETWVNERYVRDISRKIRASIRYKIQTGEFLGKAPYGYVKSPLYKNKLISDENTAPIVKKIFEMCLEGRSYSSIAKDLQQLNILPPAYYLNRNTANNQKWNAVSIRRILKNQVYVGDTVQGTSERINYKSAKMRRLPKEKWAITLNTHEAIIDRTVYEEVQQKLAGISKGKAHKGTEHLFKGLIFCGTCNSVMYVRTRTERETAYICSNYALNGKHACSSHFIKESLLKSIIVGDIFDLLNNYLKSRTINDKPVLFEGNNKMVTLIKQLTARQKQQEYLYMDKLEERITPELFNRMNVILESQMDRMRGIIELLKNTTSDINYSLKPVTMEELSSSLTNLLVKSFIERITVNEMTITVDFKYKKV